MLNVIGGAALGIAENFVGLEHLIEQLSIARLLVVGVIVQSEQSIDALDGLKLGVRADLQNFVIVRKIVGQQHVLHL